MTIDRAAVAGVKCCHDLGRMSGCCDIASMALEQPPPVRGPPPVAPRAACCVRRCDRTGRTGRLPHGRRAIEAAARPRGSSLSELRPERCSPSGQPNWWDHPHYSITRISADQPRSLTVSLFGALRRQPELTVPEYRQSLQWQRCPKIRSDTSSPEGSTGKGEFSDGGAGCWLGPACGDRVDLGRDHENLRRQLGVQVPRRAPLQP